MHTGDGHDLDALLREEGEKVTPRGSLIRQAIWEDREGRS